MARDPIRNPLGDVIPAALVKIQGRQIVIGDRHDNRWDLQATREEFGLCDKVSTHAGSLPHRIGCKGDDMKAGVHKPIRERPSDLTVHLRDDHGSGIEVHDLTVCDDAVSSEIASKELERDFAIGVCRLAHQHRRKLDARFTLTNDLGAGLDPVDERPATAAPQYSRFRAEGGTHAGTALLPFRLTHQTTPASAAMAVANVPPKSQRVR